MNSPDQFCIPDAWKLTNPVQMRYGETILFSFIAAAQDTGI